MMTMMMMLTMMRMLMKMMITITGNPVRLGANITLTRARQKQSSELNNIPGPTFELFLGPELNNI